MRCVESVGCWLTTATNREEADPEKSYEMFDDVCPSFYMESGMALG